MLFQYANVGNVWTYPQLSPAIPSYSGLVYGHFCRFIQLGAFRGGRCSGPPHVPKGGTMVADVAMDMFEKLKPEVSLSDLPEMVRIHVSIEVLRDSN